MVDAPASKRGFTLIELMVTIAVLAILLTVAIPSYQALMANNRMSAQANDLITALTFTRSEAVKRSAKVTVCASSDGATCTGGWGQGWIVRDAAGTPIRVQQALVGSSTLTGGTNSITYNSSGRLDSPTTAVTLTLCPPSPATVDGRAIQVERTGRPSVSPELACP
ncbi:MAG TPA: GspH/FimT family pseudopilin [Thiobacillus sp.]|nr:GspH/FimT family pseudopilin [Thiobacillus sp.]